MNRFLSISFAISLSILSVFSFASSSVSAASPYDNIYKEVSSATVERNGFGSTCESTDISASYTGYLTNESNWATTSYDFQSAKESFQRALNTGRWGVSQQRYASGSDFEDSIFLFWTEDTSLELEWRLSPGEIMAQSKDNQSSLHVAQIFSSPDCSVKLQYYSASGVNLRISSENFPNPDGGSNAVLFVYTDHPNYPEGYEGEMVKDIVAPPKTQVKLPLFVMQTKSQSGRFGYAHLIAQLDLESYEKLNDGAPLPRIIAVRLFDTELNEILGDTEFDRAAVGANIWTELSYGTYRLTIMGYFVGAEFDQYVALPSIVDIKVDEKGFTLLYDGQKGQTCIFRNGASPDLYDQNQRDPNTGSWISPGIAPERCLEDPIWEKDENSAVGADYDLDSLPLCDTFDLGCHLSRFFRTVTGWFMDAMTFLFIPNSDWFKVHFSVLYNKMLDDLGFLGAPFVLISSIYQGMIDTSVVGDTCALPPMTFFGSTATIELCKWRYQLPQLWPIMQLAVQGGLAFMFLWTCYRLFMRIFGNSVEDYEEQPDVQEVRWHDERTGESGDWMRRRK